MQESHTNVKVQADRFTCNATGMSWIKKTENRDSKRYRTNTEMITVKHIPSSGRNPNFGGTEQLLLSLLLPKIAQYL